MWQRKSSRYSLSVIVGCTALVVVLAGSRRMDWEGVMAWCGVERWSVKMGTDADSGKVNVNSPQASTIAAMGGWPAQANPPANNRVSPYETTAWTLTATLVEYKAEDDEDTHLVLSDSAGHTMIAEIPAPHCVGSASPFLAGITNAYSQFRAHYAPSGSFQTANVLVRITGVGMFDFAHGQTGAAPNQIELHPVIDIQFFRTVAGTVSLEQIAPAHQNQTLSFEFRPAAGGAAFTRTQTLTGSGGFSFTDIPAGSHNLAINGPKWLRSVYPVNVTNANVTNLSAALSGGDANGDNSVDSTDFEILIGAFNTDASVPGSGYDATADFNCDGFVDSTDFGLFIGDFNTMGAN